MQDASNLFCPHYARAEEFENRGFTLKTHQMFSLHTTLEEFENRGFTLKTHQMFSVHTTLEEFEIRGFTLTERIKCFPSTLRWRNLKSEVSLWLNASNVFHPHYAGERNNHRPFWIYFWEKTGNGDHVIIMTSSFLTSYVFKLFSSSLMFEKLRFSRRINVDIRPNRRYKSLDLNLYFLLSDHVAFYHIMFFFVSFLSVFLSRGA